MTMAERPGSFGRRSPRSLPDAFAKVKLAFMRPARQRGEGTERRFVRVQQTKERDRSRELRRKVHHKRRQSHVGSTLRSREYLGLARRGQVERRYAATLVFIGALQFLNGESLPRVTKLSRLVGPQLRPLLWLLGRPTRGLAAWLRRAKGATDLAPRKVLREAGKSLLALHSLCCSVRAKTSTIDCVIPKHRKVFARSETYR
jgi:hypothetical protein